MVLLFHWFFVPALAQPTMFGLVEQTNVALQSNLGRISRLFDHLILGKLADEHPLKPLETKAFRTICKIIGVDPEKSTSRKSKKDLHSADVVQSKPSVLKHATKEISSVNYFNVAQFIVTHASALANSPDTDAYSLQAETSVLLQKYARRRISKRH